MVEKQVLVWLTALEKRVLTTVEKWVLVWVTVEKRALVWLTVEKRALVWLMVEWRVEQPVEGC